MIDYFAAVTAPATADLFTPSTEIDEMCRRPLDQATALLMGAWGTTAAHDRRSWALTLGIAVVGSHDRS
ncbi:hypothetical protein Axi01nite_87620 [Actinoplanes xinjiangensis]|nr:hypothetical protein Axi01nite_87620 [Actinoplanes xinjiangensis]